MGWVGIREMDDAGSTGSTVLLAEETKDTDERRH